MSKLNNKTYVYCLLSYIYIFWLAGLFSDRDNPKVRFHVNQGIIFSIVVSLVWISMKIICSVLLSISKVFVIITSLLNLLFLFWVVAYILIGIYNVITDKEKKLPIIGGLCDFLK